MLLKPLPSSPFVVVVTSVVVDTSVVDGILSPEFEYNITEKPVLTTFVNHVTFGCAVFSSCRISRDLHR